METLYKLQPTRTIHLQGFSDFGAAEAIYLPSRARQQAVRVTNLSYCGGGGSFRSACSSASTKK